jgi:alanine racemase
MHLDAVRVGSAFLGRILVSNDLELTRIGNLVSKIEDTKTLPKGHFIGYSNTKKTKYETNIGIIPVGYLDGFCLKKSQDCFRLKDILREMYNDFKLLRKTIYVTVGHKKVPILGKIGTNNIVIKINDGIDIADDVILYVNPMMVDTQIPREFV